MNAIIGIDGLVVESLIGVYAHEKDARQNLIIDLKVEVNIEACARSDQLKDALNYELLVKLCRDIADATSYCLIETFSSKLMDAIFDQFSVKWAFIRVAKPKAFSEAKCAFIEMERRV